MTGWELDLLNGRVHTVLHERKHVKANKYAGWPHTRCSSKSLNAFLIFTRYLVPSFMLYRWRNWGFKRPSNLREVTELVSGGAGLWTQGCPSPGSGPCCCLPSTKKFKSGGRLVGKGKDRWSTFCNYNYVHWSRLSTLVHCQLLKVSAWRIADRTQWWARKLGSKSSAVDAQHLLEPCCWAIRSPSHK